MKIEIRRLFAAHRSCYGSPRITADLREEGWRVSVNTVAQIIGAVAVPLLVDLIGGEVAADQVRSPPPTPTRAGGVPRPPPPSPQPELAQIDTGEGKLYLDSILDMNSRRIVGFPMSEHHDTDCAYGGLAMAVAVRGGADAVAGVIFHTDSATSTPVTGSGPRANGSGSASRWVELGRRWTTR